MDRLNARRKPGMGDGGGDDDDAGTWHVAVMLYTIMTCLGSLYTFSIWYVT